MALPSSNKRKIFDGRYEVLAQVGRGSDSVVYHARHAGSPTQEVALKVLLANKERTSVTERLRKEALTLVSCRHRYVVRLDDFHSIGDLCYLSMEYAAGGDLRKYFNQVGGPIPVDVGERFLRQILEALDFVHATGVIHRDLKPDNILVMNERESRLADFGLAVLPGDEISIEDLQSGVGSFGYLPPEVIEGIRYDQRSDLYALGLCFYEMLAGRHPFNDIPMAELLSARSDEELPPLNAVNAEVPQHLSNVIGKLLRFDADDRFQSALAALKAINNPDYEDLPESLMGSTTTSGAASLGAEVEPANLDEPEFNPDVADEDFDPFDDDFDKIFDDLEEEEEDLIIDQEKDTPSIAQAVEAVKEASTLNSSPLSYSNTADGERIPSPTEKIDLERIKEVIAKDAQQKAEADARKVRRETASSGSSSGMQRLPSSSGSGKLRGATNTRSDSEVKATRSNSQSLKSSSDLNPTLIERALLLLSPIPAFFRPIVVGLGAALLTVVLVSAFQLFFRGGSANLSVDTDAGLDSNLESGVAQSNSQEAKAGFPALPGGLYAGEIQGVIPGITSPLSFVSLPKQGLVTVIVGIEGWSPVMVSHQQDQGTQGSTIVARSNGIILNITASKVSDTVEGTFANAVTGETGTWRVKKVS